MSSQRGIKERDVFSFRYSEAERGKRFMSDHCFDGQLVAFQTQDGILLVDTFWMHDFTMPGSGKSFTPEEAAAIGELSFVCNLDEVEKIEKHRADYYDDSDLFNLSTQHGCYPYLALRKGAKRSKEKMLQAISNKVAEKRREIDYAIGTIERCGAAAQRIHDGFLDETYLP